jgi:hypothetical protein
MSSSYGRARRPTFKDSDGSGVVVDSASGLESGDNDRGGGDQIVGKGVVQVALLGRFESGIGLVDGRVGSVYVPEARKHPGRLQTPFRI